VLFSGLLPEGLGCWENLLYEILTTDKEKNNRVICVSLQATRVREYFEKKRKSI